MLCRQRLVRASCPPVAGWSDIAVRSDTSANSRSACQTRGRADRDQPLPAGRRQHLRRSPRQDDLAAEPGDRRRRRGSRRARKRLVPQGGVVEPGSARRDVPAGLPAVHARTRTGWWWADVDRNEAECRAAHAESSTLLPPPTRRCWMRCGRRCPDPGQLRTRATDRLALGHDASHYFLTPTAVVTPRDAADVGRLFAVSAAQGVPLTFRSGGTSLSGQAGTAGILADTRKHFRGIDILDDGARVRVGPGRHRASGERPAGPVRPQARARPGQRDRLHARRCRGQQLQRDGLRHDAEHLPDAGVAGAGAAQRHRHRHRGGRRRREAAGRPNPRSTRGWPGCGTGSAATPSRCGSSRPSSR